MIDNHNECVIMFLYANFGNLFTKWRFLIMKWTGLNDLREKYLSFFESKNHTRMASSHALISNGFLRAKIFVVFIIMIVFSFNAAKLRKNNHNDFIKCFKNFIKFILLPKLPPIQEEEVLLLDITSLKNEVEIMNTLYLLHQG